MPHIARYRCASAYAYRITAEKRNASRADVGARSEPELAANARRLSEGGAEVSAFPADITDPQERRDLIQAVEQRLGPVDVLVNNAGGDLQREFHALTEDEIDHVLELNLTSAVMLTRLVLPGMLARA